MNKKHFILLSLSFILCIPSLFSAIKLPALVSSNMVLQRNTTVSLWGWADPGEEITVDFSWLKEVKSVVTDEGGKWFLEVQTSTSKEKQRIHLWSNESDITLYNILFGEVWLCSGQSNMQQPVNGYTGQPTFGALEVVANSNNPNLRLFSVDRIGSKTPIEDLKGYTSWEEASPKNVGEFSALAWFFGQQLQKILDVPVGMIHTSWGGSSVQAWISTEAISEYQKVNLDDVDISQRTNHIPTALYNSMIHPVIPYTIKGALWYQGESNRLEPSVYEQLFPVMVQDWRERWGIGDFPFYYVQIAPYMYDNDNEVYNTNYNSAFIRETQAKCVDLIPNSGMAVTMDIGDDFCIHPPKKKEVADRLLYLALNKTYGYKKLDCDGPVYESMDIEDGAATLHFKNAEEGLYAYGELKGFEIAGEDKVFHPAKAQIVSRRWVKVECEQVSEPVAVRYAWKNWIEGTLFDAFLLPASSFRTDTWDDATQVTE